MAKKKPIAEETDAPEEFPILTGREGEDEFTVVTLTGGGPGDGTFRVAAVTGTLINQGALYVLADRDKGEYHWRVP
jgi:hypothetical protein